MINFVDGPCEGIHIAWWLIPSYESSLFLYSVFKSILLQLHFHLKLKIETITQGKVGTCFTRGISLCEEKSQTMINSRLQHDFFQSSIYIDFLLYLNLLTQFTSLASYWSLNATFSMTFLIGLSFLLVYFILKHIKKKITLHSNCIDFFLTIMFPKSRTGTYTEKEHIIC